MARGKTMRTLINAIAISLMSVLITVTTYAANTNSPKEPTQKNVRYGERVRNVLDFCQAKSDKPAPVAIYFHGGGFRVGDKGQIGKSASCFTDKGVSVVAANYPFNKTESKGKQITGAEILASGKRVVQLVRSKAKEWNIDPSRVGLCGSSAGSILSEWITFAPDAADAKSEDPVARQSTKIEALAAYNQPWKEVTEKIIPTMTKDSHPLWLLAGSTRDDKIHNPAYAQMMKAMADELGVYVELYGSSKNDIKPAQSDNRFGAMTIFFAKQFKMEQGK